MSDVPDQPVRVHLVGALRVEIGSTVCSGTSLGSRKARTVLALLAAAPARTWTPEEIAEVLWPGANPPGAPRIVSSLVSRLRRATTTRLVEGGRAGYRIGRVEIDLERADELIGDAERRRNAEPGLAAAAAEAALDLLTGTPLADAGTAAWADDIRDRHAGLIRRARLVAAQARLATGSSATATEVARAAYDADPLDEDAARTLMSALAASGEPASALRVFAALREHLAEALGADPAPATSELHAELLRTGRAAPSTPGTTRRVPDLVGRDREFGALRDAWSAAAAGHGSLVLLTGVAGAGKTRLAEALASLVAQLGGDVLEARCYAAERALFLQPLVEALTSGVQRLPPDRIRAAVGSHRDALARLVPAVAALDATADPPIAGPADLERRRAAAAVAGMLAGLARNRAVLVVLDDLHNAGISTIEVLHFLRTVLRTSRLLVVGTVRSEEGREARAALTPIAHEISVGPLAPAAVRRLAEAAGQGHRGDEIARRTGGHALFVAEVLRAGDEHLPASVTSAVLARVARAGESVETLLRAAAVLGSAFEPRAAAALVGVPFAAALADFQRALDAGLLNVAGRAYEFGNDLVREVLYETTPEPTRFAHHTLAMDGLVDAPEQVAVHAEAIGDWPRAGRAWLLAAERALGTFAAPDAAALAGRAVQAADRAAEGELRGRALLVRGRARDVLADFAGAWADYEAAEQSARDAGDRRLEMAVLREQAGNVPIALGNPPSVNEAPLRRCLRLAESLGDRVTEVDILDRLTVLSVSRLDFIAAEQHAQRAARTAASSEQDAARILALDAAKTVRAYLGDVDVLADVVAELEPMLRRARNLYLLQWTVFESALVPLASGDYDAAIARMDEAIAINQRSGYASFESFFVAHKAWAYRLGGDLDRAAELGARAVASAREQPHDWWLSTAVAIHGVTLLRRGETAPAARLLRDVRAELPVVGAEAYRARCLGPLAEASGAVELLAETDALLRAIRAPDGHAWLTGADTYLCVARGWQRLGATERSRAVLDPFVRAARRAGWTDLVRLSTQV